MIFQKSISGCGLPAEDVVRALLMQSALAADGVSSKNILAAVDDIVSRTLEKGGDYRKFGTELAVKKCPPNLVESISPNSSPNKLGFTLPNFW